MNAGWVPWLPALAAATAVALLAPPRPRVRGPAAPSAPSVRPSWLMRHRLLWSALAGVAASVFVGGGPGLVAAAVVGVATWIVIARAEPPEVRRRREAVRRDLPHVVTLLGSALSGGAAPGSAVTLVCQALPGPAAARLEPLAARLALGSDPGQVWATLTLDPELGPLGRSLARAHASGTPVVAAVERLADDLASRARAEVEDRARAVGVKAAVPLGLCLLPAFVLIGIVPLVAGLLSELSFT
ncbi:MAG TPA: type II secretion system F family protein [Nocardioides sp.]|nr:type II secretion system F family protein [Nocardioides sp.]